MAHGPTAAATTYSEDEGEDEDEDGNDDRSDTFWYPYEDVSPLGVSDGGSSALSTPTSVDRRSPSPLQAQPPRPSGRRNAITSTDILRLLPEGEDGQLSWRVVASDDWN